MSPGTHNHNKREVRDLRDDTRQQPGNFSLFLRQSSLSVNNKMSSYQGSVEFDFNKESSDSESSETAEVIVEYDTESAILEESNAFDSEPEGPYMDEPFADDDWIAEYNRGTRRYKIDLITSKVWTLGKQLIRI